MSDWAALAPEEQGLLNPSFLSVVLWSAAQGYAGDGLPFELAFLVGPLVLHRATRESLPTRTNTPLPVWLERNPLVRPRMADLARTLVPFTKDALTFAGRHGFLNLASTRVAHVAAHSSRVKATLRTCTDEVRDCAKRSGLVGKWFARTGDTATVMALFGVRP